MNTAVALDHVGVAADLRIVGTVDGHGRVEAGAMLHVEHFGFHALLGDVFKHDLASDATLGSGEGEGGANGTGTNNAITTDIDVIANGSTSADPCTFSNVNSST